MRSDRAQSAPLGLKIAAACGLLFLHLPILLIFVYAFTTEEKSFVWPPLRNRCIAKLIWPCNAAKVASNS